ncbi:MAG: hypothetical protein ACYCWE_17615 [Eubacteriales bacterium]
MSKDLQVASSDNIPQKNQPKPTELKQTGDNNTQIAYVQNYDGTSTTNIIVTSQRSGDVLASTEGILNRDYYNLFVMGGETFTAFSGGHFIVPKDRVLTENVSWDIEKTVSSLHAKTIEFIKTLPTIFASENTRYGRSDDTQQAFFGMVTDVRVQDNGVKIYYQTLNAIPQKRLNELTNELAIVNRPFNELDRTHWTIKRVDLVEELRDAGITVYAP